ncbi:hypothetical protein [Haladaptatus sp. YSMS36]|uniref:hypothetical protein n=1 Tax=Haladaptatus sp. YSMS36 TaxID=3033384 RepID=UPI0023E7A0CF|nr:hypothetical protein [Haladaptatus sp. YSMS36]
MNARASVRFALLTGLGIAVLARPTAAHAGGFGTLVTNAAVPTWLTIVTGGVIVGASFMFTSLMTDHGAIRAVNDWRVFVPSTGAIQRAIRPIAGGLGVGVLLVVLVTGFTGSQSPTRNFATLFVWAGWWAGFTMSVYLVGNTWPALNPWRAVAALVPAKPRLAYPDRFGVWPSVVGLLALVWLEVVSPVSENPRLLATVILGYSVITVVGAILFGVETWFGRVDPISQVFQCYGRIAPIQRTETGLAFKLPSTALATRRVAERPDETAFIVALLWVTTYDGFIATPLWRSAIEPLVVSGVPPRALYFVAIVAGFALFLVAYRLAARRARESARTYVTPQFIEGWFAPALLPIAAGYHLAHFLAFFLTLSPALITVAANPFSPPLDLQVLVIPGWFSTLQLLFVLLGHLFAVWIAHSLAFDLFPGKLKPIRSQYPFIVVMIFYTMTSMWIVTQPFRPPPFI